MSSGWETGSMVLDQVREYDHAQIVSIWNQAFEGVVATKAAELLGLVTGDTRLLESINDLSTHPPQMFQRVLDGACGTQLVRDTVAMQALFDTEWDQSYPDATIDSRQFTLIYLALDCFQPNAHFDPSFWEYIKMAMGNHDQWREALVSYGRYILQQAYPELPPVGSEAREPALAALRQQTEAEIAALAQVVRNSFDQDYGDDPNAHILRIMVPAARTYLETQARIEAHKAEAKRAKTQASDGIAHIEATIAQIRAELAELQEQRSDLPDIPAAARQILEELQAQTAQTSEALSVHEQAQLQEFFEAEIIMLEAQKAELQQRLESLEKERDSKLALLSQEIASITNRIEAQRATSLADLESHSLPDALMERHREQRNRRHDEMLEQETEHLRAMGKSLEQHYIDLMSKISQLIAQREEQIRNARQKIINLNLDQS